MTPTPASNALLVELLQNAPLELVGRITGASNLALLATVTVLPGSDARGGGDDEPPLHVIYKPIRGERPLWDFPDGTLAGREVASYLIADTLGVGIVPPTVLRDGPLVSRV